VDADVVLLGAATEPGALHVSWNATREGPVQLFGTIGRRDVRLRLAAP
jgi:hypothetical protein